MLRLAVPVVLAELGWMSMGIVDTMMVAPLGAAAIGAVGIGTAIHMAFAIFGMGLLLGLDTLVSQAFGAGQIVECRRWLSHGAMLSMLQTPPLIGVCIVVVFVIPALGFHPDVMPLVRVYFSVVLWSTPPLLLYAAFRRYLQGMHVVTPVMFALLSANAVNAVANWTLIYGRFGLPALGVAGAAWATLFSRLYMAMVLFAAILRYNRQSRRESAGALGEGPAERGPGGLQKIEGPRLWRLVQLGFPAAAQVTLEVGVFAAATVLAGRLVPVAVASHQIALNVSAVAFMIPLGLASAGAVRVGHAVGGNDVPRAAAAGWTAILLGISFMATTAIAFVLIPRTLIGLFTRDEGVLTLGSSLLLVAAVFQLFDGVQGVATGVLRGLGDTRTPMITNLAGHWLFGLPIGYSLCFAFGYGVIGLWIGLSIGLISVGGILLWMWVVRTRRLMTTSRRAVP